VIDTGGTRPEGKIVDIEAQRRRLEELLVELDGSTRTLQGEHGDPGELSHYDQHPADSATGLSDADREEAVLQVVDRERQAVLDALERVENGRYGRCVNCDTELPEERLEARPEAARCVRCQQQAEAAS
jgi:DnaK suppressor protein